MVTSPVIGSADANSSYVEDQPTPNHPVVESRLLYVLDSARSGPAVSTLASVACSTRLPEPRNTWLTNSPYESIPKDRDASRGAGHEMVTWPLPDCMALDRVPSRPTRGLTQLDPPPPPPPTLALKE